MISRKPGDARPLVEIQPLMNQLVPLFAARQLPAPIAAASERAAYRFLEFFTAQIRNPNTRRAYARNVGDFLAWLGRAGVASIANVSSVHVAAYVEDLTRRQSAPSTKQSLAAIRTLFDWLATGGCLPFNPAPASASAVVTTAGLSKAATTGSISAFRDRPVKERGKFDFSSFFD